MPPVPPLPKKDEGTPPSTTVPKSALQREFAKLQGATGPATKTMPSQPITTASIPRVSPEIVSPSDVVERKARQRVAPILQKEFQKLYPKEAIVIGPKLFEAAQYLSEEAQKAIGAGVPFETVDVLLQGEQMLIGPGGAKVRKSEGIEDYFYKALGSGPAQKVFTTPVVAKGLKGVDLYSQYSQRSIVSAIESLSGEESWKTFAERAEDPTYGWGKAFPLNSKQYIDLSGVPGLGAANKWIDRTAGFAGDIITSPETWFTGVGGIIKQGALKFGKSIIGDLSEEAIRKAATTASGELTEAGVDAAVLAATKGAIPNVARLDALAFAKRFTLLAREEAILAKEAADQAAQAAATRAAAGAAPDVTAAKTAADKAAEVARLDAKINTLNKEIAKIAPPKSFGTASNMSNAKDLVTTRLGAEQTLESGVYAGRQATDAELALARRVVDTITPELIQEVGVKGIGILGKKSNTAARELLGATFGIKLGVPFTAKQVIIPGSEYLTRGIGSGLRGVRGLVRTATGNKLMKFLTPMGTEGILRSEDILKIRNAFTTGKMTDEFGNIRQITPEEAIDYLNVIAVHDGYVTGYNYLNKFRGAQARQLLQSIDDATWAKIGPMLTTPETKWGAAGLTRKNLSPQELEAFTRVQSFLKQLNLSDEQLAREVGATVYPRFAAFLAPIQSKDFLIWAKNNPKALERLAQGLGLDPTDVVYSNFAGRLKAGMTWFGYKLKDADIAGGTARLNELARQYGKLKYDVFSSDVRESLIRTVDRHSRYQAYVKTMQNFVEESGDLAYERAMESVVARTLPEEVGARIELLKQKIDAFLTPATTTQWSQSNLQQVLLQLEDIGMRMASNEIDAAAVNRSVQQLDNYVSRIAEQVDAGVVPKVSATVTATDATLTGQSLIDEINKVKQVFWSTDHDQWRVLVPKMLKDGFAVIDDAMPTLSAAARNDVQQMLNNMLKVSTDRSLWAGFTEAFNKLFTFNKTFLTSTVGFHSRNTQSIIALTMLAGAKPTNITEGIKILTAWRNAQKAGTNLDQFVANYVKKLLPGNDITTVITRDAFAENLKQALGVSGAGEVGSLGARFIPGEKPGVLGLPARGVGPRGSALQRGTQRASEVVANIPILALGQIVPPAVSRRIGTFVEDTGRFLLTYDGLKQGLSIDRAISRTNRFLINYSDLSALDKVGRQVFPFYTFMARNQMLQLTSVWTNPRFYAAYNNFRKNYEETERQTEFFPKSWAERGVFKMVGDNPFYFKFDLGIPQTTPGPLSTSFNQTFSQSNPLVRSVIEAYVFGDSAFTGAPIVKPELGKEDLQKAAYVMRNVVSPASTSARQIRLLTTLFGGESPVASAFASDWATILFGTKEISEEDKSLLNQFIAVAAYTGVPLTAINDDIKLRELWRRYYDIEDARKTKEKILLEEQKQLEKERLGLP